MIECTCAVRGPARCRMHGNYVRAMVPVATPRPLVPALTGTWVPADADGPDPEG